MSGWISQLKERTVLDVAKHLDISIYDRGRHLGPCPSCGETTRSRTDTRPGPLFVVGGGKGWCCGRCGEKGSVVDLVSLVVTGQRLAERDERWAAVRAKAAELGVQIAESGEKAWTPPPRQRIERADLDGLWARCARADEDRGVSAWLARRGIDPDLCGERDLVRALPEVGPDSLPSWAHFRGAPWSMGWRALFRVFDAQGRIASLRARWVLEEAPPSGGEKCGAAAGGPGSAGGAVLACGIGRQVLERGAVPEWWSPALDFELVVSEGEPDWLTWASRPDAPPVLGLFSGAWDETIAARIPSGARVAIRTHDDAAGIRYGSAVARALWERCTVFGSSSLMAALEETP